MANLPHWDDEWEEWDTILLGPSGPLPGVWDIEDGNVKRVLDIKKSPGRDGSTIKDEGYENGRLRLIGQLTTKDEWKKLQAVIDSIHPKKRGSASEPFGIAHPKLQLLGIDKVRISSIDVPRIDNGVMTVTIDVVEWVPVAAKAAKSSNTPKNATNGKKSKFESETVSETKPPDYIFYDP